MNDIHLAIADRGNRAWAREMLIRGHYLHTAPDPRTRPFCYLVKLGRDRIGCLWFGRPESTRCYQGGLTYGNLADVKTGRAAYDRWEVLNLSRVWLSPMVQSGGSFYIAKHLPGFTDRNGVWRSTLASTLIQMVLARIGFDYLAAHPPCFIEQPYQIRAVLSYCNIRLHRGTIYRAAGFELARTNRAGIETYWTSHVASLTAAEDQQICALADVHPRSMRIRESREQSQKETA